MTKAPRRCFHFDPDGIPWGRSGCPRTSDLCGFVHPDEPEWKSLPPSHPPRYIADRPHRSPSPDHKMGRDRSYGSSSHYKADRRRSPSPRHSEDSRRTYDDEYERRRRRSHDYSHRTEPSRDEKTRLDSATYAQSLASTRHLTSPSSPMLSSLPSRPLQPPTLSTLAPPRTEPPLPPPPPLPTTPSFLSKKRTPSPPQPTAEELRVIWTDRIKLLADCVQTRNQYTKVEEDIASCRRLLETLRFPSLPDEDKQALCTELEKLESQREEAKKSLEEKISHLTKSNSWPVSPRGEVEEGEVDKHQEMVKYVEELKNTAIEMNRTLNDIREGKSTTEREHVMPIDTNLPEGSARPLKRRRLSDAEHPSPPIATEVDTLRDKLLDLEDRFAGFQNDLNEHNQELMQEVKAYIEAKVEEITLAVKAGVDDPSDRYDKADQEVKRMHGEVVELAEEIGALLLRANAQETETAALQREIEESKKEYISLERRFQNYVEEREKDRNAVEALKAALVAHVAHPPSPPRSPRIPTQDYILNFIEEPLLEVVHTNVKPLVDDLRSDVEHMLRNQNTELYETLWEKLSLTLRMVEAISGRIEKGDEIGFNI